MILYQKTSGILWQYCRDILVADNDRAITDFTEANAITELFNLKVKLTGQTGNTGTKHVETMVPKN